MIEKKIKKQLYGKLQHVLVTYPAGFRDVAVAEIQSILSSLWFQQDFSGEIVESEKVIHIRDIHLFSVIELLMRSQSLSDIRLVLFEGKVGSDSVFSKKCEEVNWDFFLTQQLSLSFPRRRESICPTDPSFKIKIKVNSVASLLYHEAKLKNKLADILAQHRHCERSAAIQRRVRIEDKAERSTGLPRFARNDDAGVSPESEALSSDTTVYVDFYKNKLTLSISLAGEPLYKRGYRGALTANAPLREDAAFCCIQKAFQFAKEFVPDTMFIPFSGTGTFAFEYLQKRFQIAPVLFERNYAIEKMPLFRKEHFNFLLKKAKENCVSDPNLKLIFMDRDKNANAVLRENISIFKKVDASFEDNLFDFIFEEDFLVMDLEKFKDLGHVFMPLNPPYGIRLNKQADSVLLYKKIAKKIEEMAGYLSRSGKNILGFILCPDEETWASFCRHLKNAKMQTYHFTQGGMDIRVCVFFM